MNSNATLVRGLGGLEATTLVVGGIIGTTIFLVTSDVAEIVGTPLLVLVTWLVAGLLAGAAALCFAELSAAMPKTGGTYVFLQRAYGSEFVSFSYAWMSCFAYCTGAIAVVAIMAGRFLVPVLEAAGMPAEGHAGTIAVMLIGALTALNCSGVRQGGIAQNILTALKVGLMLAVVLLPLLLTEWRSGAGPHPAYTSGGGFAAVQNVGTAMVLCLFSYSGAYFVTHVAEEVRSPERNIPRAIITGFGLVLMLYLLINVTYLVILPFDEVVSSQHIASDVMASALGRTGAIITAFAIFCSAVGVLNAQLLNYPRIVFALARDGLFFRRFADIGTRSGAPTSAILLFGGLASIYAISGSYVQILNVVAFVAHFFISLAVLAVVILRIREPELPRPYRVWGYPFTPIAFLAVSVVYLGNLLVTRTTSVLIGILIVLAGVPFYRYWKRASS